MPKNQQPLFNPHLESEMEAKMHDKHLVNYEERAKKFQMGKNPVEKDSFEYSLCQKEKQERYDHRRNYILGIQGRDGGPMPRDKKY